MDILTNLRTFLMVARCSGFSKAARQLNVVPSVAAKRVAQLEHAVGVSLFKRTTRNTRLTEAGEQLLIKAAELVATFEAVVHDLKPEGEGLSGLIRVMAPTTLTIFHLSSVFSAFLAKHPNIRLDVFLMDKSTNPSETGFDVVISGRAATYDGVTELPLSPVLPLLCASPAYIGARGLPGHPRDLASHDCLVFRPHGSHWLFQSSTEGVIDIDISRPRMVADDNLSLLESAKAGCGLTIIPRYIARTALADGSLKTVLPDFPPNQNWIRAFVPRSKVNVPRVKVFLDHLKTQMPLLNEIHSTAHSPEETVSMAKAAPRRRHGR